MIISVEERLERLADRLDEASQVSLLAREDQRDPRPRKRPHVLVGIAACVAVLALAVGGTLLLRNDEPAARNLRVADQPDTPSPDAASSPVIALHRENYEGAVDGSQVYLVVALQTFPSSYVGANALTLCVPPPVAVLDFNGKEGCTVGIENALGVQEMVLWQEEQHVTIQISASGLSRDQLLAIATNVKRSPDGARAYLDPVPDGLRSSGGTDDEWPDQSTTSAPPCVVFIPPGNAPTLPSDPADYAGTDLGACENR